MKKLFLFITLILFINLVKSDEITLINQTGLNLDLRVMFYDLTSRKIDLTSDSKPQIISYPGMAEEIILSTTNVLDLKNYDSGDCKPLIFPLRAAIGVKKIEDKKTYTIGTKKCIVPHQGAHYKQLILDIQEKK